MDSIKGRNAYYLASYVVLGLTNSILSSHVGSGTNSMLSRKRIKSLTQEKDAKTMLIN